MNFDNNINNLRRISIIMLVAGLSLGIFIMLVIFNIQQYLNKTGNTNFSNTIQFEDLYPEFVDTNSFPSQLIEKKSDKELIVSINNKNIRVILDENTKIMKQEIKTEEQQLLDLENYDRKIKENPNYETIVLEDSYVEKEITLNELNLGQNINIVSEENVVGKDQIKALRIVFIGN